MYISTMDVENAVLKIFAELRIAVGGRLNTSTLVKIWPRTHLRHSDLHHAVQRLLRQECLAPIDSEDGQVLVLTERGQARIAEIAALRVHNLARRLRFALLPLTRLLERGPRTQAPRRRLVDRVAPQV